MRTASSLRRSTSKATLVATGWLIVLAAFVASWPTSAPAATAVTRQLDAALAQARQSAGAPAATGSVMRCGRLVWSGASGVTEVASSRRATPSTRFVVASTTKTVTAALVLDLVQHGKLSISTPLSRFYPRLPNAGRITVRMLLDHTSGLNDYFDDPRIGDLIANHPDHHWTRDEVLAGVTRTLFTPGTRYAYSNSNYVVLGGILEKVTHGTVEHAFRARVGRPARLASSTFTYSPGRSNLFAHPYLPSANGLRDQFAPGIGVPADYWGPVWTDGGLASTAPDLARFGDALFGGRLLRTSTLRTMTRLNRFGHGLGLDPMRFAGRTWLGHSGGYGGYGAQIWHDTTRGVTIAAATSSIEASATATWKALAAAYGRALPGRHPCR
jgi:D-alanyl-D-alanine carboxypeptidase